MDSITPSEGICADATAIREANVNTGQLICRTWEVNPVGHSNFPGAEKAPFDALCSRGWIHFGDYFFSVGVAALACFHTVDVRLSPSLLMKSAGRSAPGAAKQDFIVSPSTS